MDQKVTPDTSKKRSEEINFSREKQLLFWLLNGYHLLNDAIVFLLPTLLGTLYTLFDLDFTQTSEILSIHLVLIIISQLIVGHFVDRGYEKILFLLGLFLTGSSTLLMIFAFDFISFFIFVFLNGIGLGFIHAIIYVSGAKLFPKERNKKMATQAAMGDLGKMVAILSSAVILFINPTQWKLPLIIWASLSFILFGISIFIIPKLNFQHLYDTEEYTASILEAEEFSEFKDTFLTLKTPNRRLLILILAIFFIYSGSYDMIAKPYTIYFQETSSGLSADNAEFLFGILIGAGTLGAYFSGKFKDRWGIKKFLNIIYAINLPVLVLFILLPRASFLIDIMFSIVIGYTLLSVYITLQSELSYYVHYTKLGLGYAILLGIGWSGGSLLIFIAGPLADLLGSVKIYYFIALFLTIITAILIQFIPTKNK